MQLNQRVMTPLGPGTVVEFETYTQDQQIITVMEDPGIGRVRVRLDDPSIWIGQEQFGDPYIFRSQLSELKD